MLAGCAAPGGSKNATPAVTAGETSPPAATVTARAPAPPAAPSALPIASTAPLAVRAAAPPLRLQPPAGVQDIVFASAATGWLVTSEQVGYGGPAWAAGIWRTTDGGATWAEVWRGWDTRLDRVGLLPGSAAVYAAGVRVAGDGTESPLWLTSAGGGSTWDVTVPLLPPMQAPQPGFPTWSALHFVFPSARVGYAAIEPEDAPYGPDSVVLATRDGGRRWTALPLPAGFRASGGLDFPTPARGWITGRATGSCDQVWQTGDGGRTWAPAPDTCAPYTLYAVDFPSAQRGFAAGGAIPFVGAQTGLLATTDGGGHWHTLYYEKGAASVGPVTHLAFSPAGQGWAWGGTCKLGQNGPCPGRVLISRDGGATWGKTPVSALALSLAGGLAWAQGGYGSGLWRSSAAGGGWVHLALPATERLWSVATAPGEGGVWLTTGAGTFRGSDGGATWTFAGPADAAVTRVPPSVLFSASPSGLKVSRDGGRSWQPVSLPGETEGVAAVTFATPLQGWALLPAARCSQDCTLVDRTTDGGRTWASVGRADVAGLQAVGAFTPTVGVLVSQTQPLGRPGSAAIAVSTDGGAGWRVLALTAGSTCYHPAAAGSTVLVPCQAPDGSGLLLRSADAGRTWQAYTSPHLVPEDVAMTGAQRGWMLAGAGGPTPTSLYRTSDGGLSWVQVWPALPQRTR